MTNSTTQGVINIIDIHYSVASFLYSRSKIMTNYVFFIDLYCLPVRLSGSGSLKHKNVSSICYHHLL